MINFLLKEYIENIVNSCYALLVSVCFCYRCPCVCECPHLYTQAEPEENVPGPVLALPTLFHGDRVSH